MRLVMGNGLAQLLIFDAFSLLLKHFLQELEGIGMKLLQDLLLAPAALTFLIVSE